jgi:hypothetical protein
MLQVQDAVMPLQSDMLLGNAVKAFLCSLGGDTFSGSHKGTIISSNRISSYVNKLRVAMSSEESGLKGDNDAVHAQGGESCSGHSQFAIISIQQFPVRLMMN